MAESTFATLKPADLSPDAMRRRAFARECAQIARNQARKAERRRARAATLPLNSNGRRKLERGSPLKALVAPVGW